LTIASFLNWRTRAKNDACDEVNKRSACPSIGWSFDG